MIPAFAALLAEAAEKFHVEPKQITGRRRTKTVVAARHWAMREARERFGWSLEETGAAFGVGHPAVYYACLGEESRAKRLERRKVANGRAA